MSERTGCIPLQKLPKARERSSRISAWLVLEVSYTSVDVVILIRPCGIALMTSEVKMTPIVSKRLGLQEHSGRSFCNHARPNSTTIRVARKRDEVRGNFRYLSRRNSCRGRRAPPVMIQRPPFSFFGLELQRSVKDLVSKSANREKSTVSKKLAFEVA